MTPFPYLTESEACHLLNLTPSKGNAWRHLRNHAPHIKLETLAGQQVVRRTDLEAWIARGRTAVYSGCATSNHYRRLRLHRAVGKIQARRNGSVEEL